MKQMRSRFRMITLLLVCAFLLTLSLCAGSTLKAAGVTFSSLFSGSIINDIIPSESDTSAPEEEPAPVSPETFPQDSPLPETDILPIQEYNTFGL